MSPGFIATVFTPYIIPSVEVAFLGSAIGKPGSIGVVINHQMPLSGAAEDAAHDFLNKGVGAWIKLFQSRQAKNTQFTFIAAAIKQVVDADLSRVADSEVARSEIKSVDGRKRLIEGFGRKTAAIAIG